MKKARTKCTCIMRPDRTIAYCATCLKMKAEHAATHCQRSDRHVPGMKCGYPLPCPYHTVILDVTDQTVEVPANVNLGRKGLRRLRNINAVLDREDHP